MIYYKTYTGIPSLTWSEAVDEALCFGWIDSKKQTIDDKSYRQYFSKRKSTSMWSRINKQKVEELSHKGKMKRAGMKTIEIAKENGMWSMMDHIDDLIIPDDLSNAFVKHPEAQKFYDQLSDSSKKGILRHVFFAKRAATRENRIQSIIEHALKGELPGSIS